MLALMKAPPLPGLPAVPAPRDPDDDRLWLSFSRTDTYLRCPQRYKLGYVDKLPDPPGPSLSWGATIHRALEVWFGAKLPSPPPVEVLLKALYDHWDDRGFAGMPREEKVRWYREAQAVVRRAHERLAPDYVPAVASEQWFEIPLDGDVVLCGSIDHVTRTRPGGLGVVDFKTDRRAKTRQQVRASLQLALYAFATQQLWGIEPDWVALDFVAADVRVVVDAADLDVSAAVDRVLEVADAVRAEAFAPRPGRQCRWCPFRTACPAWDGEGPDVLGAAVTELAAVRRRHARDAARIAELERILGQAGSR